MEAIGCVDGFHSTTELLAILQIIMNKGSIVDELHAGGNGYRILRGKPQGIPRRECKPSTDTPTSRGEVIESSTSGV
jgi:hypothetical protein